MQLTDSNRAVTLDTWTDDYHKIALRVSLGITSATSGSSLSECFAHLNGAVHHTKWQPSIREAPSNYSLAEF